MPAAGVVLIVAVVLIVLALVYFLLSTIVALRQITSGLDEAIGAVGEIVEKSAPVEPVVKDINRNLDAGVDVLEGLLVKKAGLVDSMGLVEGLYPGSAAAGLRNFPESREIHPPRISEVYTKGTRTLARLGREAPIAAASPSGSVLRNVEGGSLDARSLYPEGRQQRPPGFPRSPVIGTGAPGGVPAERAARRHHPRRRRDSREGTVGRDRRGGDRAGGARRLRRSQGEARRGSRARQRGAGRDDGIQGTGHRHRDRPRRRGRGGRDHRRRARPPRGRGAGPEGRRRPAAPGRHVDTGESLCR